MSKNGAEIEIQSFLSDGAALPRETEMRTRRFAHSTRLLAQTRTKKNPFVTRYRAKSAFSGNKKGVLTTTCIYVFVVSFWQQFSCKCYSTILIFKQCLFCSFKIVVRISFMLLLFCIILSDMLAKGC